MRLKQSFGAVCATCAVTAPIGVAAAAEQLPTVKPIAHPVREAVGLDADLRAAAQAIDARERLVDRHVDAARTHAALAGLPRPDGLRSAAASLSDAQLRDRTTALRADTRELRERLERKRAERAAATGGAGAAGAGGATAPSGALQAIAACESGGDPGAVSPDGTYRGKYQFSRATWAAVGGSGDPAAAPEAVQDRLAAKLLATAGPGQWPVCGS